MGSENTQTGAVQGPGSGSENTKRRRGGQPTPLPEDYADFVDTYRQVLAQTPLAAETQRTYLSRVRQFLAWLAGGAGQRRFRGDPLLDPEVRDWAVRDYRRWLLREAEPKRSVRYTNNALAALDDFYVRLGLGRARVARDEVPRAAPKALDENAQIRWLRAVEAWPWPRDRALALIPFYAGLRIGDTVALDVDDVQLSARKGNLRVFGKGGKPRQVPVHPALRAVLQDWLTTRSTWNGADRARALFLNVDGGRLSVRSASTVFGAIAKAAGLGEKITAHLGRHTFATSLVRGGEDLVLVAELLGHARLETVRLYSQPTDDDRHNALRHLTTDR